MGKKNSFIIASVSKGVWTLTHEHFASNHPIVVSFIHAVMYTYYFIAMHTKVPETGKNLPIWWKSSLTIMQMIQFLIMMGQGVYSYAMNCQGVNHKITIVCFWYTMTLLLMFAKFYGDSYSKKKSKKR
jgi:elongation of very long chain fatty acids protein 4